MTKLQAGRDLVTGNASSLGRETQLFRSLCRLACDWQVDAEDFRVLLVQGGLRLSRASEIKAVLSHECWLLERDLDDTVQLRHQANGRLKTSRRYFLADKLTD